MKILTISDILVPFIYSPQVVVRHGDVDLVLGCGDLPYYYMEYLISTLNVPLLYVRGNHSKPVEYSTGEPRSCPSGGIDLHGRVVRLRDSHLPGWKICTLPGGTVPVHPGGDVVARSLPGPCPAG